MLNILKKHTISYYNKYKIFLYYLFAFAAFLMICWFIYTRFITKRILFNIPFTLTEFWVYLLLIFCTNYLYAIKVTISPSTISTTSKKLLSYVSYIITPFLLLDQLLKTNKYCYTFTIKSLKYFIAFNYKKGQRILLTTLNLIPRTILVVVFIYEVFWLHQLKNFYYFLFLGLLPLLYNYYKFSMYQNKEIAIQHLEKLYIYIDLYETGWNSSFVENKQDEKVNIDEVDVEWHPHVRNKYHAKYVSIRKYIQIILEKDIDELENNYDVKDFYEYEYYAIPNAFLTEKYKIFHNKTELSKNDYNILQKEFDDIMPYITELELYLYYLPQNEKSEHIHILNLIIYSLYFIGWGYILIKSMHTLNDLPITMPIIKSITNYILEMNPFTNP